MIVLGLVGFVVYVSILYKRSEKKKIERLKPHRPETVSPPPPPSHYPPNPPPSPPAKQEGITVHNLENIFSGTGTFNYKTATTLLGLLYEHLHKEYYYVWENGITSRYLITGITLSFGKPLLLGSLLGHIKAGGDAILDPDRIFVTSAEALQFMERENEKNQKQK